jgi:anaerobic selenocysteine-containing dehydrogenase
LKGRPPVDNKKNRGLSKKDDRFSLDRRTFLKVSAVTGAALVASRFIKYPRVDPAPPALEKQEGVITEEFITTSCLNCSTRCATVVRVVNGKAVRIAGNPLSLVSEGHICPRGHIGLQVLYDKGRISTPLKRTNSQKGRGIDPGWQPISWSEALSEVNTRLKSLRDQDQPHKLLLLSGLNTISDSDIISRFAAAYGTPNVVSDDGLQKEAEKVGRWMADGVYDHVAYDFGQSNYILAFGAGIVESEKPFARNLRMWGKMRREKPDRAKVVVIDPRYSVTASRSDLWLPINPGTDGALAMGMASVIISEKLYDANFVNNWTAGFDEYQNLALSSYSAEKVAAITGIGADTIRQIAREFARTKPAIAWIGKGVAAWPNGSYTSYAVFCLNALVGSIDVPGGIIYQENPPYRELPEPVEDATARQGRAMPRIDLSGTGQFPAAEVVTNQVADSILNGNPYPVEVAIGFNSNYNMSAAGTGRWDAALKKLPYYVHIAPFPSEMAQYADILLPAKTFMEEWGYDHSPPGSGFAEVKIKKPVVESLGISRDITAIIFEIARGLGGTVAQSFDGIGNGTEGFVEYRTGNLMPWEELRDNGVWVGPPYQYYKYDSLFKTPSQKFEFSSGTLEARLREIGRSFDGADLLPHFQEVEFLGDRNSYPLILSIYEPTLVVENGSQNYPWAQEIFLMLHGRGWTNFAEMNSQTASELGIRDGDMVWVESPVNKIKVKARVFEGVLPGVVTMASGQGHYAYGQWQEGIGVNPNDITGVAYDPLSGQSAFFNTRVKIYRA